MEEQTLKKSVEHFEEQGERSTYRSSQRTAKGSVDLGKWNWKLILVLLLAKVIPLSEFSS